MTTQTHARRRFPTPPGGFSPGRGLALACLAAAVAVAGIAAPPPGGAGEGAPPAPARAHAVLVEAEGFANKGGWVVDQQYMDQVGSPVLLAHGMGRPVADATTSAEFPAPGKYRVFVRTRNWAAKWAPGHAPGIFKLLVNGAPLDATFGDTGPEWRWQDGGSVEITGTSAALALRDLTGFAGRCDAILFTADPAFTPPEGAALAAFRRAALGLAPDPLCAPGAPEGPFDLVVCGGGMAGLCAAISAARLGLKVALVQDRPVVGGNNSSETRVHLRGRINYPPYENIGNLVAQLDPIQTGIARPGHEYGDDKKLTLARAEKNLTLYLSKRVTAVEMDAPAPQKPESPTTENQPAPAASAPPSLNPSAFRLSGLQAFPPYTRPRIRAVIAQDMETGRETRFEAPLFADCTGDGTLGHLAGAEWRIGRESRAETGEPLAPENADTMIMGASVPWNTVERLDSAGRPLKTTFPELPWAVQYDSVTGHPETRGDWNWESGMDKDQINGIEEIRDHLFRAVYGHWAWMKNHTPAGWEQRVFNRELGWMPFILGKRESRRLIGDVFLDQHDVLAGHAFDDGCVIATWDIDLHYPTALHRKHFPGEEFKTVSDRHAVRPYHIPYRCLYSKDVPNLFMAGRNISVTHVALGTVRVMRTTGMMGEVVGMAAAVCRANNATPRDVYQKHFPELVALMKKGVAPFPEKYQKTAAPQPVADIPPPVWLPRAGFNIATNARLEVSSRQDAESHPPRRVNDGGFEFHDDDIRYLTDPSDGPHHMIFRYADPVSINALRVVTGQAPGVNPVTDFVFQYKPLRGAARPEDRATAGAGSGVGEGAPAATATAAPTTPDDADDWLDVPGARATGNTSCDWDARFDAVTSREFRLLVTKTPDGVARIWDIQFYYIDETTPPVPGLARKAHAIGGAHEKHAAQGFAIHGDTAFVLNHTGICRVYDLKTGAQKAGYNLASAGPDNHANCASFGAEYPAGNDKYPALYVAQCRGDWQCFVESVDDNGARLVQTLRFKTGGPEDTSFDWVVDREKKHLYTLSRLARDMDEAGTSTFLVTRLPLPPLPPAGKPLVEFGAADILDQFTISFTNLPQGATIRGDRMYLPVGRQETPRFKDKRDRNRALIIVNLAIKEIEIKLDLNSAVEEEPEDVAFHGDTLLLHVGQKGGLYEIPF